MKMKKKKWRGKKKGKERVARLRWRGQYTMKRESLKEIEKKNDTDGRANTRVSKRCNKRTMRDRAIELEIVCVCVREREKER